MYTREIMPPRGSPIEGGTPLQGTWTRAFEEVDLLDIRRPYRCLLPRWVRDSRIKEWESFIIQDDRVYLEAILGNMKLYRLAQVFLYDKDTGDRFTFRKVIPGGGWRLPRSLANSSVDSRSYGFFFRIHSWLDADTVKLDLNIEASRRRPAFTAHAEFDLNRAGTIPMAVSLGFAGRRCMYAFKVFTSVRGDMVFGGRHIALDPEKCSGFFHDYKGFFPYRTRMVWCEGMGFDGEGRRFGFSMVESQTRDAHENNENALWINGELSPLPPVRITMPGGIESDWIIQDLEGMVDMVFTPREQIRSGANVVIASTDYETPQGYYNGMLLSSRGERIQVRNLWGLGERLYLRV
ncbi:MAG: DUF2804 domain-containing protein [Treponema sp.]|jgi:hypothetical protein|nr:DUF2804 domain-containing protein [Treponema sp.]